MTGRFTGSPSNLRILFGEPVRVEPYADAASLRRSPGKDRKPTRCAWLW
jgi:hypothetical protein